MTIKSHAGNAAITYPFTLALSRCDEHRAMMRLKKRLPGGRESPTAIPFTRNGHPMDELGAGRVVVAARLIGEHLAGAACCKTRAVPEKPAAFLAARARLEIGAADVASYRQLGACQRP